MSDFSKYVEEERRLAILRILLDSDGYTLNEYILLQLVERFGYRISADRLYTDLSWLQEQGLIRVDIVANVRIAQLLGRGEDVARGRTTVPGVNRPRAEG